MRAFILAVTGLAFAVAACSSYGTSVVDPEKPSTAQVATVSVTLPSSSLVAGQTQRAIVTLKDAKGATLSGRSVVWSSSASSIAVVSNDGLVQGVSPGAATVNALSEGIAGQADLTVTARPPLPVDRILVAINPAAVVVGQTAHADVALLDSNGNPLTDRAVTWQSGNPSVATVSSNGDIAAVAPGTASITAAAEGKTASASLSVSAPAPVPVATIAISPATANLQVGATVQLSATTHDASGNVLTGRVIAWSSANAGIASVNSNGLVTAVSAGSTQVTASSEGISSSAAITITPPAPVPVASVSVTPASSTVQVGATVQLSAITLDASNNALTGRVVTWSTSNAGIASVNQTTGRVTAVGVGSATITATSETKTGTATITVTAPPPAPVASVSVSPASATVTSGGTVQLTATLRDANNNILTGRQITWLSSNTANATVNASGLVSAISVGSVTITASSEGRSSSAAITVGAPPPPPPPPPPGGTPVWRGNEPAGMTSISDRQFNSLAEGSWWTMRAPGAAIVTDATAPQSPSNVVRFNFDAGDQGGVSPEFTELSHTGYRVIYISYWVKHSSNWQGHLTGINKHGYVWHNTTNPYFVFTSQGAGSEALKLRIALQQVAVQPNANGWYTQNVDATKSFTRGSWDLVEMVITGNTANTTNGSMDFFLNGTRVASYTGIRFHATALTKFDFTRIYPVWGGAGDTVVSNMGLSFDQFYVSGKN